MSDKYVPVEPPQWEDYFRALKLSYPENLTAIYVAKEVYSMFMAAPLRESPEDAWRRGYTKAASVCFPYLDIKLVAVPPYIVAAPALPAVEDGSGKFFGIWPGG